MQETWVRPLGWEDPLEKGKGYPLQYSGLEKSTDCIVHGVAKSWTRHCTELWLHFCPFTLEQAFHVSVFPILFQQLHSIPICGHSIIYLILPIDRHLAYFFIFPVYRHGNSECRCSLCPPPVSLPPQSPVLLNELPGSLLLRPGHCLSLCRSSSDPKKKHLP